MARKNRDERHRTTSRASLLVATIAVTPMSRVDLWSELENIWWASTHCSVTVRIPYFGFRTPRDLESRRGILTSITSFILLFCSGLSSITGPGNLRTDLLRLELVKGHRRSKNTSDPDSTRRLGMHPTPKSRKQPTELSLVSRLTRDGTS
ncbi:hypothetical protein GGR50DRAFT_340656 [Xylaria sp. CBS 124048]|nr:hypothetical protein GGR50DRAFT_340656 [Xylaria sp. CBS 124048]